MIFRTYHLSLRFRSMEWYLKSFFTPFRVHKSPWKFFLRIASLSNSLKLKICFLLRFSLFHVKKRVNKMCRCYSLQTIEFCEKWRMTKNTNTNTNTNKREKKTRKMTFNIYLFKIWITSSVWDEMKKERKNFWLWMSSCRAAHNLASVDIFCSQQMRMQNGFICNKWITIS